MRCTNVHNPPSDAPSTQPNPFPPFDLLVQSQRQRVSRAVRPGQWQCSDLARAVGHTPRSRRPRGTTPECSLVCLPSPSFWLSWLCLVRGIIFGGRSLRSLGGTFLLVLVERVQPPHRQRMVAAMLRLPAAAPCSSTPRPSPQPIADACPLYVELAELQIDDDERAAVWTRGCAALTVS
jgi:hypothetical protein